MAEDDDPYTPLYQQYKQELRGLYETLVGEREIVVRESMEEEGMEREEAEEDYIRENGPLVHDGRATYLIRKYWLEIHKIKKDRMARGESFVEPLTFLVEDLADENEDELVAFLTEIAYWPIGLDENNEWC